MTASPDKYPQGRFNDKKCRNCGKTFSPKAPSHLYCSDQCAREAFSNNYLQKTYGISLDEYNRMLEKQEHRCQICGSEGFSMHKNGTMLLVVDHDHTTGHVRGLLCHNCNRALGLLQDNIQVIQKALEYLEGATTIPKGSTSEVDADGSAQHPQDDDIV